MAKGDLDVDEGWSTFEPPVWREIALALKAPSQFMAFDSQSLTLNKVTTDHFSMGEGLVGPRDCL